MNIEDVAGDSLMPKNINNKHEVESLIWLPLFNITGEQLYLN
jgi:hypothetical protein